MQISSISAKNYRTLEDLKVTFSAGYSTISGRNNAGKSCIIRLLCAALEPQGSSPWNPLGSELNYKEDKTQWVSNKEPIELIYQFLIRRNEDSAFVSFIEKIAGILISEEEVLLDIHYKVTVSDDTDITVTVKSNSIYSQASKEINKRLKESRSLYLYNSTSRNDDLLYSRGGRARSYFDFSMSPAERQKMEAAGKQLEAQLKRLARDHMKGLNEIYERLSERYDVELSPPEGFISRRMPLGISLKDRTVALHWTTGAQALKTEPASLWRS